jgi:T4 bacteriophage base plate protein
MTISNNPLKQFFRQPAIYLRLPSNGDFWPTNAINLPENREIPVYPMTAIDEITYRTPDALFNGQATVNVIQSCVPAIQDAWCVPAVDLNAILVAIRIASFGHEMEIATACPGCGDEAEYGLDLRTVLDRQRSPDYSKTLDHGDLEIMFRSMSYRQQSETNNRQFEEQRVLQMLPTSDMSDEEKKQQLTQVMKTITEITVDVIKHSIAAIRTPNGMVTDSNHISEFLINCDRQLFSIIRDHIIELKTGTELAPLTVKCASCEHEYQQPLTLDMTSFFAPAS